VTCDADYSEFSVFGQEIARDLNSGGWFLNNLPKSAVNSAERAQKIEKITKNILTGCRYQYRLYISAGCTVLQPAERGRIRVLKKILITRKFLL